MNKVYIFGDSYGDLTHNENTKYKKWYEYVSEKYQVINKCKSGTGPLYAFNTYYESDIDKNDSLIFLLSSSHRIPFHFLFDDKHSSYVTSVINESLLKHYDEDILPIEDIYDNLQRYHYTIFSYFKARGNELIFENIKNILFLKYISELYKQKIIVFLCFNITSFISDKKDIDNFVDKMNLENINVNKKMKNFCDELYNSMNFDDNNFYLHKDYLINKTYDDYMSFKEEEMSNHLSNISHQKISQIILEKLSE